MKLSRAMIPTVSVLCGIQVACGSKQPAPSSTTPASGGSSAQAPAPVQAKEDHPVPAFKPDTEKVLALSQKPAIAAIRCKALAIENEGTRSRTAAITADVVVAGTGSPPAGPWKLVWFTQSAPAVQVGGLYLIAAEAEGKTWSLLEACPLAEGTEQNAVNAASTRLAELRKSK